MEMLLIARQDASYDFLDQPGFSGKIVHGNLWSIVLVLLNIVKIHGTMRFPTMDSARLTELISAAPHAPGVYTWRDGRGRILYIGKAVDLRARLGSYRRAGDDRIRLMVREASRIDWELTENETEALILEAHRIKTRRPKYNVVMRDDKQYAYVGITDEPFPHVMMTHQLSSPRFKKPFRHFIGPFTDGTDLKATLGAIGHLFPTCRCKQTHHVRCLNAHIGRCPGYCCLKTPATGAQEREYRSRIRAIRDLLEGRKASVVRRLERQMKAAGDAGNLEEALELQRVAGRVRSVFEHAQRNRNRRRAGIGRSGALEQMTAEFGLPETPRRIEGYDVALIQQTNAAGAMVVYVDGESDRSQYRLFNIRDPRTGDTGMLREIIRRRLTHAEWPAADCILVDGGKAQLNAALRELAAADRDIPVLALTKNDRHQPDHVLTSQDGRIRMLADLPRPLRDLLVRIDAEAHRFAISQYRRLHRTALRPRA
jgi:excinuclease ABC subunit C